MSFGTCFHEFKFSRVGIIIETTFDIIISFIIYFLSNIP